VLIVCSSCGAFAYACHLTARSAVSSARRLALMGSKAHHNEAPQGIQGRQVRETLDLRSASAAPLLTAAVGLQQRDQLGVVHVGLVVTLAGELGEGGEALICGAGALRLSVHPELLSARRFCPRGTSQVRPASRLVAIGRRFTLTLAAGW
jgi:hypothetical protein